MNGSKSIAEQCSNLPELTGDRFAEGLLEVHRRIARFGFPAPDIPRQVPEWTGMNTTGENQ
jgi:hypothetical protein